jgi:prefoldin subunit 5
MVEGVGTDPGLGAGSARAAACMVSLASHTVVEQQLTPPQVRSEAEQAMRRQWEKEMADENARLRAELDKEKAVSSGLQARNRQLERSEQELNHRMTEKIDQYEQIQKEIAKVRQKETRDREKDEGSKRHIQAELDRKRAELQRLREEADSARRQAEITIAELRRNKATLEDDVRGAEERCRATDRECSSLRRKIENDSKDLGEERCVLQQTIAEQRHRLESFEIKLHQVPAVSPAEAIKALKLDTETWENAQLKDRILRKEADLEIVQTELRQLQEDNQKLRQLQEMRETEQPRAQVLVEKTQAAPVRARPRIGGA